MNGKRFSENKARRNGFYLALAVCLVAVGIAAWSTYDAVHSYTASGGPERSSQLALENQDVRSGQGEDQDPEAVRSQPDKNAGNSKQGLGQASPEKTKQTTGSVVSQAPKATPVPTATPAPKPTVAPQPVEETVTPATAPLYERSSAMVWPLESQEVLKAYSAGAPVYSETMKDWRVHTGLDQTAQAGEEVHACANGQVKKTYTDAMLGNVIEVEHGDYVFSYCGVNEEFQVREGDIVTKGQAIGTVTAVPCEAADKPHLHIEVRRDGVCLDPQSVIESKN